LGEEEEGSEVEIPAGMEKAMNKASIFLSADEERLISLEFTKKEIMVSSRGKRGWYKEPFKAKYKGEEFLFLINPDFLLQILPRLRTTQLRKKNLKCEGENFIHVVSIKKPKRK
jgi:hypothetical protein